MERYVLQTSASEIESIFGVHVHSESILEPTFNAAPGYLLPAIFNDSGQKKIESCIWDSNTPRISLSKFQKNSSSFELLTKNACIVPINGFYLWKQTVNDPLPFYVRIHSQTILGIPGFYTPTEGSRKQFTILSRPANVLLNPLDESMPCILEPHQFDDWLFHEANSIASKGFINNEFITDMTVFRVPNLVNNISNNGPELVQPIPKLREED